MIECLGFYGFTIWHKNNLRYIEMALKSIHLFGKKCNQCFFSVFSNKLIKFSESMDGCYCQQMKSLAHCTLSSHMFFCILALTLDELLQCHGQLFLISNLIRKHSRMFCPADEIFPSLYSITPYVVFKFSTYH